jgi:dihydropteroate synthase
MSVPAGSTPLIMGILNVTPDSFSDGGRYDTLPQAVERGLDLVRQGADILDVGGESTRPGAPRVSAAAQKDRVLKVIRELRRQLPSHIVLSVDTTLSTVAAAAIDQGANIINDVSAGRDDPDMLPLAAEAGASVILMHMRGTPETMQQNPVYRDVVSEVKAFLLGRAAAALEAGVPRDALILDPGIGFGKTRLHNLLLLQGLPRLCALGYPLLLGVSRKRFMGSVCAVSVPQGLVPATCACTALGVAAGVSIFRVHDVAENRQAADVAAAVKWADAGDRDGDGTRSPA